ARVKALYSKVQKLFATRFKFQGLPPRGKSSTSVLMYCTAAAQQTTPLAVSLRKGTSKTLTGGPWRTTVKSVFGRNAPLRCSAILAQGSKCEPLKYTKLSEGGVLLDFRDPATSITKSDYRAIGADQGAHTQLSREEFRARLVCTLEELRTKDCPSCTLQLPIELAVLASVANESSGFVFDEVPEGGQTVMLKLSL
ncbi:hypothetical protein CYMTET_31553, partial [Cymbomonas tetramitiformis]